MFLWKNLFLLSTSSFCVKCNAIVIIRLCQYGQGLVTSRFVNDSEWNGCRRQILEVFITAIQYLKQANTTGS